MQQTNVENSDFDQPCVICTQVLRQLCLNQVTASVCAVRCVILLLCFPFAALAESALQKVTVLALSPYDQSVVIELSNSDMQALSVGQSPEGANAVLIDVLEDRAVFEEIVVNDSDEKRKDTVWICKAVNGVSRVQRLSRQAPSTPVHEVSRVISSESKTNSATSK